MPERPVNPKKYGEYCRVLGEINPVDPGAPKILFQVNLPADWNRKAMMFGGGGYNGIIATGTGNVPAGPANMPVPLGRGYATFGSDSGHQANAAGSRDCSFGMNDEALRNFAGDAIKKTHDAAMEIIKAGYGKKPKTTYFAGGSTGGREAFLAVGNWPKDFDGAIVLYPAWNAAALDLQFGRITQQLAMPGAYPNREKRKVLFDASIEACDALVSTRATQQYFDRLRNAMGAENVDLFMRHYEIPGYGHAISTVFNAAWDSLTTLENWVEEGIAPPPQVVADTVGVPGRTRPLCEYPSWPKYQGSGDINVAENYTCAMQWMRVQIGNLKSGQARMSFQCEPEP